MSRRIPPHKVDEIYATADILEVVGEFVQLKKRGSNYFGLSPWTNEKTPSFAVSPNKNIFKDFSTGKGGNVVTFLMEAESMSYLEALQFLAEKYNIDLEMEELSPEEAARVDRKESLFILNDFAAKWFHEQLLEGEEGRKIALSYFRERGLNLATIKDWELGWAPDDWDPFSKAAERKQFNPEFLIETGLAFRSDKTGNLIDRFRGRIMFPIHNHMGKVVGFGGRILSGEKMAKYINSPESDIYHKSKVLYGIHLAKNHIRDKDRAILVEGYMDVLALHQSEIQNAVASSGTALTEDQIRLIKRFTTNVLLIYDADKAGIRAALRGVELLLEQSMNVKVLLLPEGDDPDSFLKAKGKEAFETYLDENAQDFLDFTIEQNLKGQSLDNPQVKRDMIAVTSKVLSRISDPVMLSVYIQFGARKLNIGENVLQEALGREVTARTRQTQRKDRARQEKVQTSKLVETQKGAPKFFQQDLAHQEAEILRVLLNYYDEILIELPDPDPEWPDRPLVPEPDAESYPLVEWMIAELEGFSFEDPVLEQIRQEAFESWENEGKIVVHRFINHENPKIREVVSFLISTVKFTALICPAWSQYGISAPGLDHDKRRTLNSPLMHYKLSKVRKLLKENQEKIKNASSPEEQDELTRMFMNLLQIKGDLANKLGIVILD